MWNIQIRPQIGNLELPMITAAQIAVIALCILLFRIAITLFLEKVFDIRPRKQHITTSLEFTYSYHLAITILGLSELNWNMFDLKIWILSYACIGIIRKALYIISLQRNQLVNDYSYNNKIVGLLISSRYISYLLIPTSVTYIFWINFAFRGVMIKVLGLLTFPSVMLAIDAIFLLLISKRVQKNLIFFYNQNINQIPPSYKMELWHNLIGSSVKLWHFYNLIMICLKKLIEKIDIMDCLWIISILGALYTSLSSCISSGMKYRNMKKLKKCIGKIFKKINSKSDQICIICMQPLLNCYQLNTCGHIFHYKCFFQWVQTKEECPVCRVRINLNV